jgi:hypothetical protein
MNTVTTSRTKLTLDFATMELRADGIIELQINPSTLLNAQKSELLKQATIQLGDGQKFPFLVFLGENCTTDDTLLQYARNPENKYSTLEAIVLTSVIQKILGNLYHRFMKPVVPTKMFTNREDAEFWLKNSN